MAKYILIPDSFKGTMTSAEICCIVAEELRRVMPEAEILPVPVADGGEGTVEAFLAALGGVRKEIPCHGPYMEELTGFYGLLPDGTAVVEMAAAAGLPLVGDHKNPEQTTTYGVGELIAAAAEQGSKQIIVGLGGSATNDGGCGMAAALGVEFRDAAGEVFVPVGGTLHRIARISAAELHPALRDVSVTVMCDIDNPLCGPLGAAAVFGPQKGADEAMVRRLDDGLRHLAAIIRRDMGADVLEIPGGGAAGGMGAGVMAFLGGGLQMGIETVLDTVHFDEIAADADLVLTGEGKLDSQSLRGKVVAGVARRAKTMGVPVWALVGAQEGDADAMEGCGVNRVICINPEPRPFAELKAACYENLRSTAKRLAEELSRM